MFQVQITKADFFQPADKDNKPANDGFLYAEISGEVFGNSEVQHALLNFLFNARSRDFQETFGLLPNGHEGFKFVLRASLDELAKLQRFNAAKVQAKALLGDAATEEQIDRFAASIVEGSTGVGATASEPASEPKSAVKAPEPVKAPNPEPVKAPNPEPDHEIDRFHDEGGANHK